MATARLPLRIWAGEKGEGSNIGIIIYRDRLPPDVSVKELRKRLLREIRDLVASKFAAYGCRVSPNAQSWLAG